MRTAKDTQPLEEREVMTMRRLLIADKDKDAREILASQLIKAGYNVTVTDSVAHALNGILKKTAEVAVIGSEFDNFTAADLIPLLRQCNRDLTIILVADEIPLSLIRRVRKEGIFYHALKPVKAEDRDEICQAVECAFDNLSCEQRLRKLNGHRSA